MQNILKDRSRLTTARVVVPAGTTPDNPKRLTVSTPAEIVRHIYLITYPETVNTPPLKTGWRLSSDGVLIAPAPGSEDDSNFPGQESTWIPGVSVNILDVNQPLAGPPFQINLEIYNSESTIDWYYFFIFVTTPKIDLPVALVTADEKKND